jgi:hypothetical protein
MSWIKTALVIIGIFITPFLILDAYFLYDKLSYRVNKITCDRNLTNYDYCPSIVELRYMNLADRWLPIINFIDKDRMSTYKDSDKPTITKNKRIFLIGDSFIQAEELEINSRFEHYLRKKGYEVIAMGYSSWNSVQFHSIIQTLNLNKNDHVFVFSMGNDYTPSYYRASVKTSLNDREDEVLIGDTRSFFDKIYENSLINNTFLRAKAQIIPRLNNRKDDINFDKVVKVSHDEKNWNDCTSIPATDNIASALVGDYIYLSKNSKCWSDEIKSSVDYNVSLLKESRKIVEDQGAVFTIALVSAGWALKGQNTMGRMHEMYQIPNDITVSQVGLLRYLKKLQLPVLDLEILLKQHEVSGINSLYFPADGHWNEKAHEVVGKYLEKYILKTNE